MVQAINRALHDAMAADDRVLVFGEDVAKLGGVFRVTEGLAETFGDGRCFDTPLAESAIIGIAIGMAIRGFVPVPEIQFDGFSYPAFDQMVSHLAKYRMRTHGDVDMPVTDPDPVVRRNRCGRTSFGVHRDLLGAHRGPESGGAVDAVGCVLAAAACDRQPGSGDLPGAQAPLLGARGRRHHRARPADRPGGDPAHRRRRHRDHLRRAGRHRAERRRSGRRPARLDLEVVDLRSLNPLDFDTVAASVRKTGRAW